MDLSDFPCHRSPVCRLPPTTFPFLLACPRRSTFLGFRPAPCIRKEASLWQTAVLEPTMKISAKNSHHNKWVDGRFGQILPTINPATGEVITPSPPPPSASRACFRRRSTKLSPPPRRF